MRADETIAPQDCEHPIERKSLTLDERIKALNDIDQEFDNDVLRGFGEALNLIDELSEEIKNLLCVNAEQDRRANALRDSMEGKIKELETLIQDYVTANIGHVKHIAELETLIQDYVTANIGHVKHIAELESRQLKCKIDLVEDVNDPACETLEYMRPTTEESSSVKEG